MPPDRQITNHHRPSAAVAKSKAEIDVGDPVVTELWIEAVHCKSIRPAKGHAVAFDRIDPGARVLVELLHVGAAQPVRTCRHHLRISQCGGQGGDRIAGQLDARVEQHTHLPDRGFDAGIGGRPKSKLRVQADDAQALRRP